MPRGSGGRSSIRSGPCYHSSMTERPPARGRGVAHVSSAPTRSGQTVPMHVSEMTLAHARWWHTYVQPWIDSSPDVRADKGWRWGRIYATTHLAGAAFRQRPVGLVAGVLSDGEMLPVCMAIVVASYPHLPDPSLGSVFLWYATRCPDHVIELALRVSADMIPKRLMEITVDLAITRSFQAGHEGRTGLHASVDGGDDLCAKYESFGMLRLPRSETLPKGMRRYSGNDGRYFYHSEATAAAASRRLDPYRPGFQVSP